jgi:RNA polymerase sigma-70 factor (ECF subfamily)
MGELGIPQPFDELIRRYEREIMRYLMRVTANRDDAADLFQETWIRAYRAYPRIDSAGELRPWLYAIATNLCRNHFRNGMRRARVIAPDSDAIAGADVRAGCRLHAEGDGYAAVHLRQTIGRLPNRQRQAVMLRYFAGMEYPEMATAMECSEESARANLSQAMKKLKAAR